MDDAWQTLSDTELLDHLEQTPRPLLTGPGGDLPINEDDRRLVGVFSGGVAVVLRGRRWTSEVKSVLTEARRAGHPVTRVIEVDAGDLARINAAATAGGGDMDASRKGDLEIERQKILARIISDVARMKASDIHLRVLARDAQLRIRIHGRMQDYEYRNPDEGMALIKAAMAVASDTGSSSSDLAFQQGALTPESGLLPPEVELIRLQYSPTTGNRAALVMRLKYRSNPGETDIGSLGYREDQVRDIAVMRRRTRGLYMLAGKMSSGKSTTLQRVLNRMLQEKRGEISMYTIEEPVELDVPGAIQVNARDQPDGEDGFVAALKALLRSDANVIVVGEIRSSEIAGHAIQGVLSGHAVWSTIHAGSALGILDRLIDFGVEPWKVTDPDITRGLVYQRLIGTICPHCRIDLATGLAQGRISRDMADRMVRLFGLPPTDLYLRGPGCSKCLGGLTGRTVVAEMIQPTPMLLDLFREGRRMEMRRHWLSPVAEGGMGGLPVAHHALTKVGAGLCDIDEVEEEVELLEAYETTYPQLAVRLAEDVRRFREGRS